MNSQERFARDHQFPDVFVNTWGRGIGGRVDHKLMPILCPEMRHTTVLVPQTASITITAQYPLPGKAGDV